MFRYERGIGAVVEQHLDHNETVIAEQGVMEGRVAPHGHEVGVGAVVEGKLETVFVVPIGLAEEDGGEAFWIELTVFEQDSGDGIDVAFRDVVGGLFVAVGIGSVGEEQPGQFRVTRDAGDGVNGAFKDGARVGMVDHLVEAGGGAGTCVEQSFGGVEEGVGPGGVVLEEAREAEVGEGVPFRK